MKNNLIKKEIKVQEKMIEILKVGNINYISLTDLARYADNEEPRLPIRDWMRSKEVISFLGLWENLNNPNFKRSEFAPFKNEAGSNKFKMSPQKWIKSTNAIGIISKSGRYEGGTYAHPDIAFEFASWLSPEFKLYLIKEFERLKQQEAKKNNIEWSIRRSISKTNYKLHTESIKDNIIPYINDNQKSYIYADEADVINVALFGMTSRQ